MSTELRAQLEKLFADVNLIRPRDLTPAGIPRWALSELVADGTLYRSGRGLYGLTTRSVSTTVSRKPPSGFLRA